MLRSWGCRMGSARRGQTQRLNLYLSHQKTTYFSHLLIFCCQIVKIKFRLNILAKGSTISPLEWFCGQMTFHSGIFSLLGYLLPFHNLQSIKRIKCLHHLFQINHRTLSLSSSFSSFCTLSSGPNQAYLLVLFIYEICALPPVCSLSYFSKHRQTLHLCQAKKANTNSAPVASTTWGNSGDVYQYTQTELRNSEFKYK